MCTVRCVFCTCTLWQVPQRANWSTAFSCAFLGDRRVHRVARGAADVARVVRAARPERVIALVVAGHADRADVTRGHLRELLHVPLRVVVDVRLAGAVAALAAMLRGRRLRIARHAVLRSLERLVRVTRGAGVVAHVVRRRWRLRLGCRRLRLRNGPSASGDRVTGEEGKSARQQHDGSQAGDELMCELMSSHAMTPGR